MSTGKLTASAMFFGILGSASLAYAVMRRPRYIYEGQVVACEGSEPVYGIGQGCTELYMQRGGGSGKLLSPLAGTVTLAGAGVVEVTSTDGATIFSFKLAGATPTAALGQKLKAGDVIAQAERVLVSAYRAEGGARQPMPPSAWLAANALQPASVKGPAWCEDSYQQIVPHCNGVTFRAPPLPKVSFRTLRMTLE
jgi:hypothetical protein